MNLSMNFKSIMRIVFTFAFIFSVQNSFVHAEEVDVNGQIDWNGGVIQSNGLGFAPTNVTNSSQMLAMSRRAAVLDAYRNMLETVKGIRVDADTTINNLTVNDNIHSRVSGVVRGAHIIREESTGDGGYRVTLEIKLFGDNSVASAVLNNPGPVVPLPQPTYVPQVSGQTALPQPTQTPAQTQNTVQNLTGYTGVVIDARGLGLDRVMSPVIFDDKGRPIYGNKNLDTKFVVKYGMAGYVTEDTLSDVTTGNSRAGTNPLIIKAVGVKDFGANVIISEADANKLLIANQQSGFLTKAAVVFEQ